MKYLMFPVHIAGSLMCATVVAAFGWYLYLAESIEADIERMRK